MTRGTGANGGNKARGTISEKGSTINTKITAQKLVRSAQRIYQHFRFIGDDRVHAPCCQFAHLVGTIHGPNHDLLAGSVELIDQVLVHEVDIRDYPTGFSDGRRCQSLHRERAVALAKKS